jgi:hypothetical protein
MNQEQHSSRLNPQFQIALVTALYVIAIGLGIACFILSLFLVFNFYVAAAYPCLNTVPAFISLGYLIWAGRRTVKNVRENKHGWRDVLPILVALSAVWLLTLLITRLTTIGF